MAKIKIDYNDLANKPPIFNCNLPLSGNTSTAGKVLVSNGVNTNWDITPNLKSSSIVIGESLSDKLKIYIVEPWESVNPIKVNENLHISLGKDLIKQAEIKNEIIEKVKDVFPELIFEIGMNEENIVIVKQEFTLEINP